MLKSLTRKKLAATGGEFVIIASLYNQEYVDAMLKAAKTELGRHKQVNVTVVRVPGAYEIPVVAKRLARVKEPSAIICLGVILRGQTVHAEQIGTAVSSALMQIQLAHEIPVIHEVLLLENREQAKVRCLDKKFNRGAEAAQTALVMAELMRSLPAEKS